MFKFKRLLIAISAALAFIFIFSFNQVGVQADMPAPHLSASAAADLESFCKSLWVHEGAQQSGDLPRDPASHARLVPLHHAR